MRQHRSTSCIHITSPRCRLPTPPPGFMTPALGLRSRAPTSELVYLGHATIKIHIRGRLSRRQLQRPITWSQVLTLDLQACQAPLTPPSVYSCQISKASQQARSPTTLQLSPDLVSSSLPSLAISSDEQPSLRSKFPCDRMTPASIYCPVRFTSCPE